MFWQDSDLIQSKYIYHTANIEYRALKLMCCEFLGFLLLLLVLTQFALASSTGSLYECRQQQLAYWDVCPPDKECRNLDGPADFWDLMRDTITPRLFPEPDVTDYP